MTEHFTKMVYFETVFMSFFRNNKKYTFPWTQVSLRPTIKRNHLIRDDNRTEPRPLDGSLWQEYIRVTCETNKKCSNRSKNTKQRNEDVVCDLRLEICDLWFMNKVSLDMYVNRLWCSSFAFLLLLHLLLFIYAK